jgi:mannose/cellobiose epimerase-like protein (N-acyl-D-glucosamine 2-epimerase family)
MGLRLARWVLGRHVNLAGRWPGLRDHDLVEFIAQDGGPAHDLEGRIISDPGHTLEFVGLFLKFRAAVQRSGGDTAQQAQELARMARLMPAILARAFDNGFRPAVGGIIKSLDLLTRRAIDDTMPWWSLPETIRAAAALLRAVDLPEDAQLCRRVISLCHNAFTAHYLRPDVHLMAVKLRDASGRASGIVPAYPDADPGYHTALSLMDVLAFL